MKKIILATIFCGAMCNVLNAQFTVTRIDGTPFVNNEIVEFTTVSTPAAELKFIVNNNSAENLDFRIRVMDIVNATGNNFQLCWGYECIPSVVVNNIYPNFQYIINAGANTVGFGDSFKNFNNGGEGAVFPQDYTFRIFTRNLAGATVGSNFNITYRYQGPLSIEQKDKLGRMGVKVLNNVAREFIGLEINKAISYSLINLQGQSIENGILDSNTNLNVSHLQSGIYLLSFTDNQGLFDTVKIVKR